MTLDGEVDCYCGFLAALGIDRKCALHRDVSSTTN